jgi:hypothetical protein
MCPHFVGWKSHGQKKEEKLLVFLCVIGCQKFNLHWPKKEEAI